MARNEDCIEVKRHTSSLHGRVQGGSGSFVSKTGMTAFLHRKDEVLHRTPVEVLNAMNILRFARLNRRSAKPLSSTRKFRGEPGSVGNSPSSDEWPCAVRHRDYNSFSNAISINAPTTPATTSDGDFPGWENTANRSRLNAAIPAENPTSPPA
jgi:hypothetical protein